MFTAKVKTKEKTQQGLAITVEFTDGTETFEEVVKPQDRQGFEHFVKSRLKSLNSIKEMESMQAGDQITIEEPVIEETARDIWIKKYQKLQRLTFLKDQLEKAGSSLTATQTTNLATLAGEVKSTFKANYLD